MTRFRVGAKVAFLVLEKIEVHTELLLLPLIARSQFFYLLVPCTNKSWVGGRW